MPQIFDLSPTRSLTRLVTNIGNRVRYDFWRPWYCHVRSMVTINVIYPCNFMLEVTAYRSSPQYTVSCAIDGVSLVSSAHWTTKAFLWWQRHTRKITRLFRTPSLHCCSKNGINAARFLNILRYFSIAYLAKSRAWRHARLRSAPSFWFRSHRTSVSLSWSFCGELPNMGSTRQSFECSLAHDHRVEHTESRMVPTKLYLDSKC